MSIYITVPEDVTILSISGEQQMRQDPKGRPASHVVHCKNCGEQALDIEAKLVPYVLSWKEWMLGDFLCQEFFQSEGGLLALIEVAPAVRTSKPGDVLSFDDSHGEKLKEAAKKYTTKIPFVFGQVGPTFLKAITRANDERPKQPNGKSKEHREAKEARTE